MRWSTAWAHHLQGDKKDPDFDPRSVKPLRGRHTAASRRTVVAGLNRHGITPTRPQWVICVETTAIEIPGWARAKAEPRLTSSPHRVWFRGRSNGRAKILERQDRAAGGNPEVTAVEFRVCGLCGRVMLAQEAQARRKVEESHRQGRELPCGNECKDKFAVDNETSQVAAGENPLGSAVRFRSPK